MVAASLANMSRGDNQHTAIAATSQGDAAQSLNVSADSVQRAVKVRDAGTPELVAAVEQGRIAVSQAAQIATRSEAEQKAIVAKVDGGEKPENQTSQLTMLLALKFVDEFGENRDLPVRSYYFDFRRWAWIPSLSATRLP